LAELRALRPFARPWLRLVARWLELRGLVRRVEGGGVLLTGAGRREARRVTRNHRLWEQFLIAHADLAPSHVDRSADLVEHVLSPAMVAELERQLAESGRLPPRHAAVGDGDLPPSAHPLATA
jgi:manganese/zinc/iron transport system permease protein